jgi:FixJ family two-component response regulator
MSQKSVTVYVVDGDESIRRALKRLLRSEKIWKVSLRACSSEISRRRKKEKAVRLANRRGRVRT